MAGEGEESEDANKQKRLGCPQLTPRWQGTEVSNEALADLLEQKLLLEGSAEQQAKSQAMGAGVAGGPAEALAHASPVPESGGMGKEGGGAREAGKGEESGKKVEFAEEAAPRKVELTRAEFDELGLSDLDLSLDSYVCVGGDVGPVYLRPVHETQKKARRKRPGKDIKSPRRAGKEKGTVIWRVQPDFGDILVKELPPSGTPKEPFLTYHLCMSPVITQTGPSNTLFATLRGARERGLDLRAGGGGSPARENFQKWSPLLRFVAMTLRD